MAHAKKDASVVKFLDYIQDSQTKTPVRLVQVRDEERRLANISFHGTNRREDIRRSDDKIKLNDQKQLVEEYKRDNDRLREKNASLVIPHAEVILWCLSMIVGLFIIFGWNILLYTF
jgi:hypothetical protein